MMHRIFPLFRLTFIFLTVYNSLYAQNKNITHITKFDWLYHVDSLLMPYWMSDDALGYPPGNYPAYRYPDGRAIDPDSLDYSILITEYQPFYMATTDSLRRDFVRVKSRQIYGYCIAYHLTGNEKYLRNAKLGLDYLIDHGAYEKHSAVTFWQNGKAMPGILQRNAQDLAYALLSPAIYYYLTRDPETLKIIVNVNRFFWQEYYQKSSLQENSKLLSFVKENFETDSTHFKELLAPLDQLNAYLLLMARIVPDSMSSEFRDKATTLAYSLKDNFYSAKYNLFWGNLNKKALDDHTDFAHSIKTFWMLYMTAHLTRDKGLEEFAGQGARKLLATAFISADSGWAAKYKDDTKQLDRNTFAWHHAELDQMAATLSFADTSFYSKYLFFTYPYFEKQMVDHKNKGTYWGRNTKGEVIEVGFRSGWHMANFHDLEHALIGYLSTANYHGDDIILYYAFINEYILKENKIQPYHYQAQIKHLADKPFTDKIFEGHRITKVTFTDIR